MKRLAAYATTLALVIPLSAQSWATNNPSTGSGPATPLTNHGLAFDTLRSEAVLYGGRSTAPGNQETWTFDGTTWVLKTPANSPPALWGHMMVAAPQLGGVILWGGRIGTSPQSDTWLWNGANWAQITTAVSPPARAFGQMAFDARRGVVVMHGGGYLFPNPSNANTWEFNGKTWTEIVTNNAPAAVGDGRMDFDASRGVCVLFGGWNGSTGTYLGTWEYDGIDWREVFTTNTPSGRQWQMMTYDSLRARIVMHGGLGAANGTWEYDGSDWELQNNTISPIDAPDGKMCYDSARKVCVYVGGRGPSGANNDVWEYSSTKNNPSYAFAGSGCAGTGKTPDLAAAAGSTPKVGTSFTSEVSNLSGTASSVFLIFGFINTNPALPFDLSSIGMTNCMLHCTSDVAIPVPVSGGKASLPLPLPMSSIGGIYWNQAFVIDSGSGTPLGAILSNAMRAQISN